MNKENLGEQYWTERYLNRETGWDVGMPTPPLTEYFDQLSSKDLHILIPGAGNAYEADYLANKNFSQVTVCDLSAEPLKRFAGHTVVKTIHGNFFDLKGTFDLIVEQTFFCALDPMLRSEYVQKCHNLLKPGGKVAGVLFKSHFEKAGPPFGGTRDEYEILFGEKFHIKEISDAYNSIPPRFGNELFVIFEKRI